MWARHGLIEGFFITMIYKKEIFLNEEADTQIQSYANKDGKLYIEISEVGNDNDYGFHYIVLNKDTAKELVKTIQKEIKLLDDE